MFCVGANTTHAQGTSLAQLHLLVDPLAKAKAKRLGRELSVKVRSAGTNCSAVGEPAGVRCVVHQHMHVIARLLIRL